MQAEQKHFEGVVSPSTRWYTETFGKDASTSWNLIEEKQVISLASKE